MAAIEKQTKRTDLWTWEEKRRRESKIHGESNMETYIIICKIESHWESAVYLREFKWGHCINLEGWGGEARSRGRGHMYTYG